MDNSGAAPAPPAAGMMKSRSAPAAISREHMSVSDVKDGMRSPDPKRTKLPATAPSGGSSGTEGLRGALEAEVLRAVFGLTLRPPAGGRR